VQLLDARRTQDGRRNSGLSQEPRDCQLGHGVTPFLGILREALDTVQDVVGQHPPHMLVAGEAASFGWLLSLAVLARKQALGERAVVDDADALVDAKRNQLFFR